MLAANAVIPETVVYDSKDVEDQDSSSIILSPSPSHIPLSIPVCEKDIR